MPYEARAPSGGDHELFRGRSQASRKPLDRSPELQLGSGFELARAFAGDTELAPDLRERQFLVARGHQAAARDETFAFVERGECHRNEVAREREGPLVVEDLIVTLGVARQVVEQRLVMPLSAWRVQRDIAVFQARVHLGQALW